MKRIWLTGSLLIVIAIFVGAAVVVRGQTLDPEYAAVREVDVTSGEIAIKGQITDSGRHYVGYRTEYKNGILSVRIKARIYPSTPSQGDIEAAIPNKYDGLREIRLVSGDARTAKTIWPK